MDYTVASIGRVFVLRVDHGENPVEQICRLALMENIRQASFMLIGAVGSAGFVCGPREKRVPPEVVWKHFSDVHEVLGVGNIFWEDGEPRVHLHAAFGSREGVDFGCLREDAEVFMVVEVVIFELAGFRAERVREDDLGFSPITFERGLNFTRR
jgi:hypothetical protein